jgi:hypothetical protein
MDDKNRKERAGNIDAYIENGALIAASLAMGQADFKAAWEAQGDAIDEMLGVFAQSIYKSGMADGIRYWNIITAPGRLSGTESEDETQEATA